MGDVVNAPVGPGVEAPAARAAPSACAAAGGGSMRGSGCNGGGGGGGVPLAGPALAARVGGGVRQPRATMLACVARCVGVIYGVAP